MCDLHRHFYVVLSSSSLSAVLLYGRGLGADTDMRLVHWLFEIDKSLFEREEKSFSPNTEVVASAGTCKGHSV